MGSGRRMFVEFTPVKIRISPTVIRLLSAIAKNVATPQEAAAREQSAVMIARRHLWDERTTEECNFWFLNEGNFVE